jgi:hypothetical protein
MRSHARAIVSSACLSSGRGTLTASFRHYSSAWRSYSAKVFIQKPCALKAGRAIGQSLTWLAPPQRPGAVTRIRGRGNVRGKHAAGLVTFRKVAEAVAKLAVSKRGTGSVQLLFARRTPPKVTRREVLVDAAPVAQEAVASATAAAAVSAPARRSRQSFPSAMVLVSSFEIVIRAPVVDEQKAPAEAGAQVRGVECARWQEGEGYRPARGRTSARVCD